MKKYLLLLPLLAICVSVLPSQKGEEQDKDNRNFISKLVENSESLSWEQLMELLADENITEAQQQLLLMKYKGASRNSNALFDAYGKMEVIKTLLEPKNIVIATLFGLGIFGSWHLTSGIREVVTHKLLIPPLATETNITPWYSFKKNQKEPRVLEDVILSQELTLQVQDLLESIRTSTQYDLTLRNYFFYGIPGTGKTLLAKTLADQAGMKYMFFPASKLLQYSEEEGQRQINRLFEYASDYPEKLMIIMDEFDAISQNRDTCPPKVYVFLDTILSHMGTESPDFMVIAMSNRPGDMDNAALSRYGEKLHIAPPGQHERERIFKLYVDKSCPRYSIQLEDTRSWYKKLFSTNTRFRDPLVKSPDLTDPVFAQLAQLAETMVGRDIADIVYSVAPKAYRRPDMTITKDLLFDAVAHKKAQNAAMQLFAQSHKHRP